MPRSARRRAPLIRAAGLAAGLAAVWAVPALSQAVSEEVVVTARYRGQELRSLSTPVSYRDLDLTTERGRDALKQRVKATAKDSCRRLGEGNMGATAAQPSCEQDAINSAAAQEKLAFARAKPHRAAP